MKHEDELAREIATLLDEGVEQLGSRERDRLAQARKLALGRARSEPALQWVPAWAAPLSRLTEQSLLGVRYAIPLTALVVGLMGVVYLNAGAPPSETAELDMALLTDELPINAYLDQNFQSWLKRSPR